jgi:hypothetical protein
MTQISIKSAFKDSPIIIGGCGRSGTTLLAAILSAHPNIYSYSYETMAFCPMAWDDPLNRSVPFSLDVLEKDLHISFPKNEHTRFLEKTPKNTLVYARIAYFFDKKVKIINLVRDGRDVVLSKYPGKEEIQYTTADFWKTEILYGMECESFPWLKTIRYEDLILDFKNTLLDICDFCELPFHNNLINYVKFTQYSSSDAWTHKNVILPHSNSIGKWKNELDNIEVNKINSNPEFISLLKRYNYETISDHSSI